MFTKKFLKIWHLELRETFMLQQYAIIFQGILALYCVTSLFLMKKPLAAAVYFIAFRSTFAIPAALQIPSFVGGQFFLPALFCLLLCAIFGCSVGPVRLKLHRPIVLYLTFYTVTTLFGIILIMLGKDPVALLYENLKILSPILIYFLVYCGIKNEEDLGKLGKYLVLIGLIQIVTTWISYLLNAGYNIDTDSLESLTAGPISTLGGRNGLGIFLSVCLFFSIPSMLRRKTKMNTFYILLLVATIIVSQNRGTWIALFIGIIPTLFLFRKYLHLHKWFLTLGVISILAAPIVIARFDQLNKYSQYGDKMDTAADRVQLSAYAFDLALQSPIVGNGPFSLNSAGVRGSTLPHNDYLRIASEYGFPAMFLYIWFLFSQLKLTLNNRTTSLWPYHFAACFGQIYLIVISSGQNIVSDSVLYSMIFALMATSHRAALLEKPIPQKQIPGRLGRAKLNGSR